MQSPPSHNAPLYPASVENAVLFVSLAGLSLARLHILHKLGDSYGLTLTLRNLFGIR